MKQLIENVCFYIKYGCLIQNLTNTFYVDAPGSEVGLEYE